jgi:hypothetical protein
LQGHPEKFKLAKNDSMKHLYLLFALLFSCHLTINAQSPNLLEDGERWTYEMIQGWTPGSRVLDLEVVGDTMVGGLNAKKISLNGLQPGIRIARADNDRVFKWQHDNQQFLKIYDFSLQAGESILLPSFSYLIDSTGVTDEFGPSLRFQEVIFFNTPFMTGTFLIVEGMGLVGRSGFNEGNACSYFFPDELSCDLAVDGIDMYFRCFKQNGLLFDPYEFCLNTVGEAQWRSIRAFPNPASEEVQIQLSQPVPAGTMIQIFDLTGRLILSQSVQENSSLIDIPLQGIPSGQYLLILEDQTRRLSVEKLVVFR